MRHAEFHVVRVEEDKVFVVDPDSGSKSITNDAEWVWEQVSAAHPGRRLIYRDTMGRWDEIVPVIPNERFGVVAVNFRPYNEEVPLIP